MEKREAIYNYYKSQFSEIEIVEDSIIKKYSSVAEEYNFLKHGVGIRDLSNFSKIFIHGKDSESLLRRLATNKIVELNVLEWVKTLFINNDGNIIDRTLLMKFEDYFILIGSNTEERKLLKWINRFIIDDDIVLSNSCDDYSLFEVMGTQATSYMTMILGDKFSEFSDKNILRVQIDNFFVHGIRLKDCGAIEKYVVLVDSINAVRTLEIMQEMKSVFDLGMVGEDAYNVFRIEHGIPIAPNELNDSVNPLEVKLGSEICAEKNNFIGHENVEDERSDKSRIVKIKFEKGLPDKNIPISIVDSKNKEVGLITSIADADIIKFPIGLGFIDVEFNLNGNSYFVDDENSRIEIKICEIKKA